MGAAGTAGPWPGPRPAAAGPWPWAAAAGPRALARAQAGGGGALALGGGGGAWPGPRPAATGPGLGGGGGAAALARAQAGGDGALALGGGGGGRGPWPGPRPAATGLALGGGGGAAPCPGPRPAAVGLALGGGGGALARAQAGTAGGGLGPSSSELSPTTIASARDDIVMACVRRLAGDGVYWDRLRVSGRVRGATCAAPRKNRPTSLRGAFPSSRAANLTTTRDAPPSAGPPPQPLDGRAAAPRRAPPGTGTGSPMALFLRCWTATRRAAAARAVSAERVHTRTAQNEICGFGAAGGPYGRVWRSAKVESGRCGAPARRPQKPAGTLRLALLRPLKNPLRGSRPTWAVWAPRRRRPPDRSALLRFFDSQSNMGLPATSGGRRRPPSPSAARGRRWVLTPPWRTRCTSSGVDWGPNFITRTAAFRPARTRARDDARRRRSRRTRRVASPTTSRSSGTSPVPPSAKCEVSSLACLRGVSAASCRPCWSHQRCGARKGRLIRGPGGERSRS